LRITVLSDTHMPRKAKQLPDKVLKSIERTDAIIHAGDFMDITVLEYLRASTNYFQGVAGNNDGYDIYAELGQKKIIELNGYRIGIIHGDGYHGTTLQIVKHAFANEMVDVVIFGHSHKAYQEWDNGVLYFNPGSPTDKRRSPRFSFGEINLGQQITAKIQYFL